MSKRHLIFICELAEEWDLDKFALQYDGRLPEKLILQIFAQILLGVNFLHKNNIDHRDLKPKNILLFHHSNLAKLADFGQAKEINEHLSKMTAGLGTDLYSAPEVKNFNSQPFKSDIYSLGLILHFMLTRTVPYNIEKIKINSVYSEEIKQLMLGMLK